jgi:Pvc16 N-terminal domain
MSNDLAIATVTATLKHVLENAVTGRVQGTSTTITVGQPDPKDAATSNDGRVNIFLYQVTHNSGWRNADLPTRRADGSVSQRPMLALDLHYILSFYGDKSKLLPERLMGLVMKTLNAQPFLTRKMIQETLATNEYSFLAESSLAEQPELVKLSPISLSLEELSKIWSIFFQTQYVLSTAYQGTVVLIESEDKPVIIPPVSDRSITVGATPPPVPASPPTITQILSQAGAEDPITPNSRLLIQGQNFAQGEIRFIQLEERQITPDVENIHDTEIILPLPSGAREGVKTLQIVYHNGICSNLARFTIRSAGGVTP